MTRNLMGRTFSLYLDLVRFCAACLVYVYHSNQRWLVKDPLPLSNYGHSSVIVFFVLSGFVIAYVTDTKERDWISYSASRLSRVFSVVLPTLVLTLLLDAAGRWLNADAYSYPFDRMPLRILGSLLMANEVWGISITYFSNVPYWSITYEFWYYALFGILTFAPGRLAAWLVAAVLLLVGPKVLLLAPIWYAGVLLYRWKGADHMPMPFAWLLSLGSTAALVWTHQVGTFTAIHEWFSGMVGAHVYREMTFSRFFLADYLLCLLVVANFAGMRRLCRSFEPSMPRIEAMIRFFASFTFTLYLLHQPLFLFWGSVFKDTAGTLAAWWLVSGLSFVSVWAIGQVTESRRHAMRNWFVCRMQRLALGLPGVRETR